MALSLGNFVSKIENATVQEVLRDGVLYCYQIKAVEGYVLHDKELDADEFDENFEQVIGTRLGYTTGICSCAASYDFTANPREFYAVPRDSVPADQIYGGGDNHEKA